MVYDYEKAMEDRKEKRERRLGLSESAEKSNLYDLFIAIKNADLPRLIFDIKANNPSEAIEEVLNNCKKYGLDKDKIEKENCRIRDKNTREIFNINGQLIE